jgi:nucleotide-binding universal stress UspA family protein
MARTIRRIVVALDHSPESRSVLEEAVSLAATMKAELAGLFVEDATLLNAAQLSPTRQLNFSGQTVDGLDPEGLERVLRGQAEAIRAALEHAAMRQDVAWSFRVARGKASIHILSAVPDADLVIMGKTTPSVTRRGHIGSTARIIANAPRGSILFSEPRQRRVLGAAGPVVAVYGEGPHADAVLDLATHLATAFKKDLLILVPGDGPGQVSDTEARARARLADTELRATYRRCVHRGCDAVLHALSAHRGALLVLAQGSPLLGQDSVTDLIERVDSPVLVVADSSGS